MKERPILFRGEMVRAILEGRKTQTRRVIKYAPSSASTKLRLNPDAGYLESFLGDEIGLPESDESAWFPVIGDLGCESQIRCPYGQPSDHLWVRESWATVSLFNSVKPRDLDRRAPIYYLADGKTSSGKKRPSIHMPRWASRITLEIVNVRVERLQDISYEDMLAEGVYPQSVEGLGYKTRERMIPWFSRLWDSINGKTYPWESNPWLWVVEFKQEKP